MDSYLDNLLYQGWKTHSPKGNSDMYALWDNVVLSAAYRPK